MIDAEEHPESTPKPESSSDEDGDGSHSEEEDGEPVEMLVHGRERRSNAGSRMQTLLDQQQQEEDDEIAALFNEDGLEDNEFEDPDADGSDEHEDDSSSDDDDQGPQAEEGDLEGERELRRQERAAKLSKKRKAPSALTRPLALRKRVKIAAVNSTGDAAAEPSRPRKKSERTDWTPEDIPTRLSNRTLSIQNRQKTMESVQESKIRSAHARELNQEYQKRRKQRRAAPLTQEERLAQAARIEEENLNSLTQWEEEENDRVQKQKERQAALLNRNLHGPVIRWYSGPAEWLDDKLIRVGREEPVEYQEEEAEDADAAEKQEDAIESMAANHDTIMDTDIQDHDKQDPGAESKDKPPDPPAATSQAMAIDSGPLVEEMEVQEPAIQEPPTQEPAIQEPTTQEPAVRDPTTRETATSELTPALTETFDTQANTDPPNTSADQDKIMLDEDPTKISTPQELDTEDVKVPVTTATADVEIPSQESILSQAEENNDQESADADVQSEDSTYDELSISFYPDSRRNTPRKDRPSQTSTPAKARLTAPVTASSPLHAMQSVPSEAVSPPVEQKLSEEVSAPEEPNSSEAQDEDRSASVAEVKSAEADVEVDAEADAEMKASDAEPEATLAEVEVKDEPTAVSVEEPAQVTDQTPAPAPAEKTDSTDRLDESGEATSTIVVQEAASSAEADGDAPQNQSTLNSAEAPLAPTPAQPQSPSPPKPAVHSFGTTQVISLNNFDATAIKEPLVQRRILFNWHPSSYPSAHLKLHTSKAATKAAAKAAAAAAGEPMPTSGPGSRGPYAKTSASGGPKPICALTGLPAKYRDPVTGLAFRGVQEYRALRTLVAHRQRQPSSRHQPPTDADDVARWSNLLGAWVGGGGIPGRVAAGVPPGFEDGTEPQLPPVEPVTEPRAVATGDSTPVKTEGQASTSNVKA